jgi:hypothetical protein
MATKKEPPRHFDKIGHEIKLDDVVVSVSDNSLILATVIKINPKTVKISKICDAPTKWNARTFDRYGHEVKIINGPEVTLYLLKK